MQGPQISPAEQEILETLWALGGNSLFSPIMERLEAAGREWKTNTVLTFLARLAEKGLVRVEKRGRNNEYIALYSKEQYQTHQANALVEDVFQGNAKNLVAALLQHNSLTQADMDELTAYWKKRRETQ